MAAWATSHTHSLSLTKQYTPQQIHRRNSADAMPYIQQPGTHNNNLLYENRDGAG